MMTASTTLVRPAAPPPGTRAPAAPPPGTGAPSPATADDRPWDRVRFRADTSDPTLSPDAPDQPELDLPPVGPWAGTLVRAAVEVLTGSRPVAQLARWLEADLYEALCRRAGLAVRIDGRPRTALCARVRRVRCRTVTPGIHAVAVVVHDGVRVRSAAVEVDGRWGRQEATATGVGAGA